MRLWKKHKIKPNTKLTIRLIFNHFLGIFCLHMLQSIVTRVQQLKKHWNLIFFFFSFVLCCFKKKKNIPFNSSTTPFTLSSLCLKFFLSSRCSGGHQQWKCASRSNHGGPGHRCDYSDRGWGQKALKNFQSFTCIVLLKYFWV